MKQVFGAMLMAVGILIAGASGLCSLMILGGGIAQGLEGVIDVTLVVFFFGGIPFGIGLGMFFGGRALVRQAKLESSHSAKPQEPKSPVGPESTSSGTASSRSEE